MIQNIQIGDKIGEEFEVMRIFGGNHGCVQFGTDAYFLLMITHRLIHLMLLRVILMIKPL